MYKYNNQYLPNHDVLCDPLSDELVAVHRMQCHPQEDWEQGADQGPNEKLFDGLQVGVLASRKTKKSDRN